MSEMERNGVVDVHYERPLYSIDVTWAGLRGASLPPLRVKDFWLIPRVSVYVDLPRAQRGVHTSRLYRAITLLASRLPEEGFSVFSEIARRVLDENEYAERARISLTARVISEESDEFKGFRDISVDYTASRSRVEYLASSASTEAFVACPCALRVSEQVYSKPYTHTSKLRVRVTVKSSSRLVDPLELLGVLSSVLNELANYLRREEEARVLKASFENPMFAEDVARLVAVQVARKYSSWLNPRDLIIVTTKSCEVFHEYNLYAVLRSTLSEVLSSLRGQ